MRSIRTSRFHSSSDPLRAGRLKREAELRGGDPQQALALLRGISGPGVPPSGDLLALMSWTLARLGMPDARLAQALERVPPSGWYEPRRRALARR